MALSVLREAVFTLYALVMAGGGLWMAGYLRLFPLRRLPLALGRFFKGETSGGGKVSSFGASASALAGSLGTGNIAGVAAAVAAGGPGAVFWMWVSAAGGMALKYSEILLASKYAAAGDRTGPMGYITRWAGPVAGWTFAAGCIAASLTTGNMAQTGAAADGMRAAFGVPGWAAGAALGGLALLVARGGSRRAAKVCGRLVPAIGILYIAGAGAVLVLRAGALPAAFGAVFRDAFSFRAAGGGVLGLLTSRAFRTGVARGVFTSEAGLGSAPIVHSAAENASPADEGLWGVAEVALDTLLMCTLTAAVLLVAPAEGLGGAARTAAAFSAALGGWAGGFLGVCGGLLAFASLITWQWCGGAALAFLGAGKRGRALYRAAFFCAAAAGGVFPGGAALAAADLANFCMAAPNLLALFRARRTVRRETFGYLCQKREKK